MARDAMEGMVEDLRHEKSRKDFMRDNFDGTLTRQIVPEAQAGNPLAECFEIWQVEHGDAKALAVVQVYRGDREPGDNGFDVFVQATPMNNLNATVEAVRAILQRHHQEPLKVGKW